MYQLLLQIQFHVTIGHTALSLYSDCPFPKWMHWCLIGYALTFIILFGNFYYQTYRRQPRREGTTRPSKALSNGASNGAMAASNGNTTKMDEKPTVAETGRRKRKGRAKREWIQSRQRSRYSQTSTATWELVALIESIRWCVSAQINPKLLRTTSMLSLWSTGGEI